MQFADENRRQDNKINPNIFLPVIRQHFSQVLWTTECNLKNILWIKNEIEQMFFVDFYCDDVNVLSKWRARWICEIIPTKKISSVVSYQAAPEYESYKVFNLQMYKFLEILFNLLLKCANSFLVYSRVISFFQKSFEISELLVPC